MPFFSKGWNGHDIVPVAVRQTLEADGFASFGGRRSLNSSSESSAT